MSQNWKGSLYCFHLDQQEKLQSCIPEKGEPTKERLKDCPYGYLAKKLIEHLEAGNFVDVANFAFLLYQRREGALKFIVKEGSKPQ